MPSSTIPILDPQRELAEMAGELVQARGFGVTVAERFKAAVTALRVSSKIRVAVCHATMPSEIAADVPMIDELAAHPDIALVVFSSRPFEEVPGIARKAVRLAKPFGAGELLEAVARVEAGFQDGAAS